MRLPWKLVGLAGLAGVAATGVVIARKRRSHHEYSPDELRDRLHHRLAEVKDPVEPAEMHFDQPGRKHGRHLAAPRRPWRRSQSGQ